MAYLLCATVNSAFPLCWLAVINHFTCWLVSKINLREDLWLEMYDSLWAGRLRPPLLSSLLDTLLPRSISPFLSLSLSLSLSVCLYVSLPFALCLSRSLWERQLHSLTTRFRELCLFWALLSASFTTSDSSTCLVTQETIQRMVMRGRREKWQTRLHWWCHLHYICTVWYIWSLPNPQTIMQPLCAAINIGINIPTHDLTCSPCWAIEAAVLVLGHLGPLSLYNGHYGSRETNPYFSKCV